MVEFKWKFTACYPKPLNVEQFCCLLTKMKTLLCSVLFRVVSGSSQLVLNTGQELGSGATFIRKLATITE